jgi:CRP-like cAMP-binding protein
MPSDFIITCDESEVIFEENSPGETMYVISTGKVRLQTMVNGRELVLDTLGPGDFFGEMALVDDAPRSATAVALENDTRLVVLDQTKFLYLVNQQPPFALFIMHGLCRRLRNRWESKLNQIDKTELVEKEA